MNIQQFVQQINQDLDNHVRTVNLHDDNLTDVASVVVAIRRLLEKLKEFVISYKFLSEKEEIHFFKTLKPMLVAQLYYHQKVFKLRLRASVLDVEDRERLYRRNLHKVNRCFRKDKALRTYLLFNHDHLDTQYFMRSKLPMNSANCDSRFTSCQDDQVARILARELFFKFLDICLQRSKSNGPLTRLTWTGSKTDLTELIYALQAAKVFENGNADIKKIATTFESLFNINLGDFYRTFQSIQTRKGGHANFLGLLKERLEVRIADVA